MSFPRRFYKLLGLWVAFVLILNGCAYKKLIFNNLDWLVVYQLDSYLDLSSTQEKQIKIPVHETVDWIKAERLPNIIDWLKDCEKTVETRKVSSQDFDRWSRQLAVWRLEVTDRMATPLALLLKQLDKDQLEHLENKLQKGDRELQGLLERSESEFPKEFIDYVDEAAGGLKFWFGKLRKDQKQLMVDKLGWNREQLSEQLKQRKRSREYWLELIAKSDSHRLSDALKASAEIDGVWKDPEYQKFRQQSRERWRDFFLALFVSLDDGQWQHLSKVLRDLVGDMETLNLAQVQSLRQKT